MLVAVIPNVVVKFIHTENIKIKLQIRRILWIRDGTYGFVSLSACLSFSCLHIPFAASMEASKLIGTATWNFNLASTQDRLINYGDEYYGKSYLVMTFFPAAFTPV